MRLFLLPISTRRTLIYCERSSRLTTNQKTLLDKATAKAAQIWVQWEKSNKKWQRTVTEYGNRAFQRIPFEEWGLKSIPPLSPQRRAEGATSKKVEVTFPLTLIRPDSVGALLRKLGTERQSLHRKRMWWSIVGMPITLPMALVPVMVTLARLVRGRLPYSTTPADRKWLALSGSKHLEFLLDNNLTKLSPSSTLDELYSAGIPHKSEQRQRKEVVLLQQWNVRLVAQALGVPELHPELERALRQVEKSLTAEAALNDDQGESDVTKVKDERGAKR